MGAHRGGEHPGLGTPSSHPRCPACARPHLSRWQHSTVTPPPRTAAHTQRLVADVETLPSNGRVSLRRGLARPSARCRRGGAALPAARAQRRRSQAGGAADHMAMQRHWGADGCAGFCVHGGAGGALTGLGARGAGAGYAGEARGGVAGRGAPLHRFTRCYGTVACPQGSCATPELRVAPTAGGGGCVAASTHLALTCAPPRPLPARPPCLQRALPHLAQPPQQCEPSCDAQQQRIEQLTAENAGLQQQQGGAGVQCGDAEAKQQQQQQLAKQVEQLKAEKKVAEDKAAVAAAASSAFSVEGGPMQPWVDKHWDFKLPMEGRRRGTQQRGDLSRLRAALLRAASGDPLRVFFAGGSVTRGVGSTLTAPPFPARFGAYLNATYPPTKGRSHTVVNGGVGGTTSMMYDMCAGSLLPPDFNIYVLEFTANDVPPQHACERGGERAGACGSREGVGGWGGGAAGCMLSFAWRLGRYLGPTPPPTPPSVLARPPTHPPVFTPRQGHVAAPSPPSVRAAGAAHPGASPQASCHPDAPHDLLWHADSAERSRLASLLLERRERLQRGGRCARGARTRCGARASRPPRVTPPPHTPLAPLLRTPLNRVL